MRSSRPTIINPSLRISSASRTRRGTARDGSRFFNTIRRKMRNTVKPQQAAKIRSCNSGFSANEYQRPESRGVKAISICPHSPVPSCDSGIGINSAVTLSPRSAGQISSWLPTDTTTRSSLYLRIPRERTAGFRSSTFSNTALIPARSWLASRTELLKAMDSASCCRPWMTSALRSGSSPSRLAEIRIPNMEQTRPRVIREAAEKFFIVVGFFVEIKDVAVNTDANRKCPEMLMY